MNLRRGFQWAQSDTFHVTDVFSNSDKLERVIASVVHLDGLFTRDTHTSTSQHFKNDNWLSNVIEEGDCSASVSADCFA